MINVPLIDIAEQNRLLRGELDAAIKRCMDNNAFCLGPEVENFEKSFADWIGTPHAIGFNSGTSALHIAACLLDAQPGDEIITTPMTFAATAWAISYTGATPVFADIDPGTMNICPASVCEKITPRTKAIFAVHLFGQLCDVEAIRAIANEHNIAFVEDAAQAHGAALGDVKAGSFGDVAGFSFYPGKNLGAIGEGGGLVTHSDAYAGRARSLRNHGCTRRYYHDEVGFNYRMEGIQAAALSVKLAHLDEWLVARQRIADTYDEKLADLPLTLPARITGTKHANYLYVIRTPEREALERFLTERKIGTARHYPIPLHLQDCYKDLGYQEGDLPVAEEVAGKCLSIPIFPEMTTEQQEHVCQSIREYFTK